MNRISETLSDDDQSLMTELIMITGLQGQYLRTPSVSAAQAPDHSTELSVPRIYNIFYTNFVLPTVETLFIKRR